MVEDKELILQYASNRSEAAFAELVRRHIKMVYAAALRQVNGDFHLAEDVAQTVFSDLARKAGKLECKGSIAGLLYASARYAAANAVRSEARRRVREQAMNAMNETHTITNADWDALRPIIDEALGKLGDADREAIVLRYFESLEFSLVGTALGLSESGARMKVERALEKLRGVLQRRGLATTSDALAGVLAESSAVVVPVHLAAGITSAALTQAATTAAGSVTSTILKLIAMKKIALVTIGVLALSLATVVVVKTAHKPPGVRKMEAKVQVTLGPDETLVTGGWPMSGGKRTFVFITPTWIDAAGNRVQGPQGDKPQLTIESTFTQVPERDLARFGLQSALGVQNDSTMSVEYSDAQMRSLLAKVKAGNADILTAPKVTTLAGRQAKVAMEEERTIAGKVEKLGPSVDVLPSVSSDGISVDLVATVRIAMAAP